VLSIICFFKFPIVLLFCMIKPKTEFCIWTCHHSCIHLIYAVHNTRTDPTWLQFFFICLFVLVGFLSHPQICAALIFAVTFLSLALALHFIQYCVVVLLVCIRYCLPLTNPRFRAVKLVRRIRLLVLFFLSGDITTSWGTTSKVDLMLPSKRSLSEISSSWKK